MSWMASKNNFWIHECVFNSTLKESKIVAFLQKPEYMCKQLRGIKNGVFGAWRQNRKASQKPCFFFATELSRLVKSQLKYLSQ